MLIKASEKNLVLGNMSSYGCPIALALKDMGCQDVAVHPLFATFEYNGDFLRIDFPNVAIVFISWWDAGYQLNNPFEFNAIPHRVNRGE